MKIKSIKDIYNQDRENLVVKICDFNFSHSVQTLYDPSSELSKLDQFKNGYRQVATFNIGFFESEEDFILKKCMSSNSIKLPNILTTFHEHMSIDDLDKQDASVYFDNILKNYLIRVGVNEENIVI